MTEEFKFNLYFFSLIIDKVSIKLLLFSFINLKSLKVFFTLGKGRVTIFDFSFNFFSGSKDTFFEFVLLIVVSFFKNNNGNGKSGLLIFFTARSSPDLWMSRDLLDIQRSGDEEQRALIFN